jgi:thioredoxin reductase (NADPH)
MIETDAVIIGAGPVGLYQAFQLGLLEIGAHIVDALPAPGGQCIELYPDKPIYDIPGIVQCSGRELAERLQAQVRPFNTAMHFGHLVAELATQPDGRFALTTSAGLVFNARSVFIAAGVGAFQPRALKVNGLDPFEGTQVLHQAPAAGTLSGQQVLVFGDDDVALSEAVALATSPRPQRPASVTLVHRRDAFSAAPDVVARLRAACDAQQMRFVAAQAVGVETNAGRLTSMLLIGADGATFVQPADIVLALLGLSPKLGPIAHWGLAMAKRQLQVDTEQFQTNVPGIHAVGDINTYPGKRKLITCGFHEATLAAYGAAQRLRPGEPVLLQYTTTSPRLHKLLGV